MGAPRTSVIRPLAQRGSRGRPTANVVCLALHPYQPLNAVPLAPVCRRKRIWPRRFQPSSAPTRSRKLVPAGRGLLSPADVSAHASAGAGNWPMLRAENPKLRGGGWAVRWKIRALGRSNHSRGTAQSGELEFAEHPYNICAAKADFAMMKKNIQESGDIWVAPVFTEGRRNGVFQGSPCSPNFPAADHR